MRKYNEIEKLDNRKLENAFDKVVEHNNNYIVKMFAECITDGRWAAEKYMIID